MRVVLLASTVALASAKFRKLTVEDPGEAVHGVDEPDNIDEWNDLCKYLNGPASYCKYWLDPPHCLGDDTNCGFGEVPDPAATSRPAPTTTTPVPTTTPERTTTPEPTTATPTGDVLTQCDNYCKSQNTEKSYCKWWLKEPVCKGGDQSCGSLELCPYHGEPFPTSAPSTSKGDGAYHPECDTYCQGLNGEKSYCKWWLDEPMCKGGDQHCGGGADYCSQQEIPETTPGPATSPDPSRHQNQSPECDEFCAYHNGEKSYCKWWQKESVCKGGDQPCGVGQCGIVQTTHAPDATAAPSASTSAPSTDTHDAPSDACDAYCNDQNPSEENGSYCKWWLDESICKGGNQSCAPSVCEDVQ